MRIALVLATLGAVLCSGCIWDRGVCVETDATASGAANEVTVTVAARPVAGKQTRCGSIEVPHTVRLAWTQDETYPPDLTWFVTDLDAAHHVDASGRWRHDAELPVCQNVRILAYVTMRPDGKEHEGQASVFLPC